jgi:hypothetical protein
VIDSTTVSQPVVVAPAPVVSSESASAGASASTAAPTNMYVVPAQPAVVARERQVILPNSAPVTAGVAQSGPGATDKVRPGFPDDNTGHSAWDVGTSSAGS